MGQKVRGLVVHLKFQVYLVPCGRLPLTTLASLPQKPIIQASFLQCECQHSSYLPWAHGAFHGAALSEARVTGLNHQLFQLRKHDPNHFYGQILHCTLSDYLKNTYNAHNCLQN